MKKAETLQVAKRLVILLVLSVSLAAAYNMRVSAQQQNCTYCGYQRDACDQSNISSYSACLYAVYANESVCHDNAQTNYSSCLGDCSVSNPPSSSCTTACQNTLNSANSACDSTSSFQEGNCDGMIDWSSCAYEEYWCLQDCE